MISGLFAAIKTVAKRMIADWLVLVSALVTIVLATALLAAGPVYADAVTLSALQRTLHDSPVQESNVTVKISVFPDDYDAADDVARSALNEAFSTIGADVFAQVTAESFAFAGQPEDAETIDLASFQFFEEIEGKATIIDGRWPQTSSSHETAVLSDAATALGLQVGDQIDVVNRTDASIEVRVALVGTYEPNDTGDPFWFEDELALTGVVRSSSFDTYGPFVVTEEVMVDVLTRARTAAGWRAIPNYETLGVSQVDQLRADITALGPELERRFFAAMAGDVDRSSPYAVTTGLGSLLNDVDRSLTVTRASVLALLIQLAILAGYALVLMAGLIADTRRTETTLVRSRGASPIQIFGVTLLESIALVVPAVIIGPFVATALLRILNRVGPLADIGLTIDPTPTSQAYILASVAGVLSIVALVVPAVRSARGFKGSSRSKRQQTRAVSQRVGLDFALLGLAFVAFWQLDAIGEQISARVAGQFGVDPLLVVAPALGLLTGAVLALRVVPLLASAAEWLALSGRSTVSALASWQIARRPTRYARSSLLLMMAIGIGFFAASYATTWAASQRDQAAYEIGADVVVTPNRSASALTDIHLAKAHEEVNGVVASLPVESQLGPISRSGGLGQFMILDTSDAGEVVQIREDLGPEFDALMDQLHAGRPSMGSIPLEGEPTQIGVTLEASETLPPEPWPFGCEATADRPSFCEEPVPLFEGRLRVIIQDGDDRLHRIDFGFIPVNTGRIRMTADLVAEGRPGQTIPPAYPLSVVNIEIQNHLSHVENREVELLFDGLSVFEDGWTDQTAGSQWSDWSVATSSVVGAQSRPSIETTGTAPTGELVMTIQTGVGFFVAPSYFSIRALGTEIPDTFPVVVSNSFLTNNISAVGDEIRFPSLNIAQDNAVIVGTVAAFPTVDADVADVVVVDLPTFQMMGYQAGRTIGAADSYWIATNGDDDQIRAALSGIGIQSFRVESTSEQATSRASDPVALGTIGALTVGFVAAAVFASVGFAVSATVSARERLVELALLRALGLSPRQLAAWLFLEQGALVLISLGLGTLIGIILTATILPLISLTQDGSPAFPVVIVEYPWDTVLTLELAVVAVLGLIVTLMTVALRRVGLGSLLRMGEE